MTSINPSCDVCHSPGKKYRLTFMLILALCAPDIKQFIVTNSFIRKLNYNFIVVFTKILTLYRAIEFSPIIYYDIAAFDSWKSFSEHMELKFLPKVILGVLT